MTDPTTTAVLFDVSDGVATITLNRPDQLNTINGDLSAALLQAFHDVRDRDDIRVALLTGSGRAFCAGADLRSRADGPAATSGPASLFAATPPPSIFEFDVAKPVIGAINGFCLGGGFEIALLCDILVASEAAQFGLPEITLGFFPLAGGPVRLPRSIPRALANDMLFTGERIDAATALRFGVVSRVVPPGDLHDTALAMARRIAGYAPVAVRALKELVRRQADLPTGDALRLASTMRYVVGQTDDAREGPRAFAEKRQPVFTGR